MNRKAALFMVFLMALQAFFYQQSGLSASAFPFLDGVPIGVSHSKELRYLMIWYFPIFFISVFFSGFLREGLVVRGIPAITRNFSKAKWALMELGRMVLHVALLVALQCLIFAAGNEAGTEISLRTVYSAAMYFLLLTGLTAFQSLLDLYWPPKAVLLAVNGFVVASILSAEWMAGAVGGFIPLPTAAMGMANGLSASALSQPLADPLWTGILLLGLVGVTVIWIVKRIGRMDII